MSKGVLIMEIWKDVKGYEGHYQVSNLGRLKRTYESGRVNILSGKHDKDGYVEVILSMKGRKKYCRLHRLVAEAFIPNPEGKTQVNHKDKNTQNNFVNPDDIYGETTNLEWVTPSENVVHSFRGGRYVYTRPVVQFTKDMEHVTTWDAVKSAANALGLSHSNISACCAGRLKTSGGYIWRYKEVAV